MSYKELLIMVSFLQRLELTPLPLGLIEEETEEDVIDQHAATAEEPQTTARDSSAKNPKKEDSPGPVHLTSVAILRVTDRDNQQEFFPSTTDLIPTSCSLASITTMESTDRLPTWIDNASLMVTHPP